MRINFYEAMLADGGRATLVKEKAVNYEVAKLASPQDIVLLMQRLTHMGQMAEERCYLIAFNIIGKVLGVFFLSKGTVNSSLMGIREIYMRALLVGATQIILIHNHPSGNIKPSEADIQLTKCIGKAGEILCVQLMDHIIIGGDSYFSFKEAGLLEKEDKGL